jgi:hypothetical protein
MKGNLREPGGPIGSIERSTMGATCKGQPKRGAEPRSGVGPFRSTNEASEGNEGVEGREWPEGNQSGEAKVRTQSRVALPLNLWRVYAAARRNKQAQFTALMHHVDVVALERAFRRLKRKASAGVDGETVETYEQNLAGNLKDLCERVQPDATGHGRCAGSISLNRMAVSDRSGCPPWKTRSSRVRSPRC